jgi:hypothetical protein
LTGVHDGTTVRCAVSGREGDLHVARRAAPRRPLTDERLAAAARFLAGRAGWRTPATASVCAWTPVARRAARGREGDLHVARRADPRRPLTDERLARAARFLAGRASGRSPAAAAARARAAARRPDQPQKTPKHEGPLHHVRLFTRRRRAPPLVTTPAGTERAPTRAPSPPMHDCRGPPAAFGLPNSTRAFGNRPLVVPTVTGRESVRS